MYSFVFFPPSRCAHFNYFRNINLSCQKTCHKYLSCRDNKIVFYLINFFFFLPLEISLSRFVSATLSVLL